MPRMQWIHTKREQMAAVLGLPALDVAALEATGRSRVPSLQMPPEPTPLPTPPQFPPCHPVQELGKTER